MPPHVSNLTRTFALIGILLGFLTFSLPATAQETTSAIATETSPDQDAAIATPPLTTMSVSPYQLGRKLARVALDRIRDPEMPTTISLMPAELITRESTGPAPKEAD